VLASGTVSHLHRWPLKSAAGEPSEELELDGRGVIGDRTLAVFDEHKGAPRRLTARQAPRLLAWRAAGATITAPDGRSFAADDPALASALTSDLGRPVTVHADSAGQQDLPRSVLVTTQATLDAIGEALGSSVELDRFRTNVHVVLDAPAYAEEQWEGTRLRIGEAELEVLHPCERCVIPTRDPTTTEKWPELLRWLFRERTGSFGINARPLGAARIRLGDAVTWTSGPGGDGALRSGAVTE